MVISLFGVRERVSADSQGERVLIAELLAKAREQPGFIGYHLYTSEDGEELGVIRFETREALDAWRDDPRHRAAWQRAREFYAEFWVQNCETFREYVWRDGEHLDQDLADRFRSEPADLASGTVAERRAPA
jgi:heme-degrading monooxygenase HmoA